MLWLPLSLPQAVDVQVVAGISFALFVHRNLLLILRQWFAICRHTTFTQEHEPSMSLLGDFKKGADNLGSHAFRHPQSNLLNRSRNHQHPSNCR